MAVWIRGPHRVCVWAAQHKAGVCWVPWRAAGSLSGVAHHVFATHTHLLHVTHTHTHTQQAGHIATWAKEKEADGEAEGWLHDWSLRRQLNWDTRAFFALASNFTQQDYLQAQVCVECVCVCAGCYMADGWWLD